MRGLFLRTGRALCLKKGDSTGDKAQALAVIT